MFDCRTINDGMICPDLHSWDIGMKDEISSVCTCKALNCIIFPEIIDEGKLTQKLNSV